MFWCAVGSVSSLDLGNAYGRTIPKEHLDPYVRARWPRRTWLFATLGTIGLQQLSHFITPPAANVNLAFSVYAGWERYFPTYGLYWLVMFAETVTVYYLADRLFRHFFARRTDPSNAGQELLAPIAVDDKDISARPRHMSKGEEQ